MTRGAARPLTPGEVALCRTMFGEAIDYGAVSLHRRRWWPLQPRETVMAPDGHIWFHPRSSLWREDFAASPLALQGLLIHEMAHVWQHQHGIFLPLRRHPFCRYDYALKPGWPLSRYGIEQQAEIVRHAFLLMNGAAVPGAPDVEVYRTLLYGIEAISAR